MSAKFPRGGEQTHSQPSIYKIRILDLMLLPKNSVPCEGLYYSTNNASKNHGKIPHKKGQYKASKAEKCKNNLLSTLNEV